MPAETRNSRGKIVGHMIALHASMATMHHKVKIPLLETDINIKINAIVE
jgi:hypothetical protein